MQVLNIKNGYGLENVTLEHQTIPKLKDNEVLVKIHAVSLNQLDLMIAKGAFNNTLPHTLGSDAAGIVEQVGSKVSTLKSGDSVITHFIQTWQSGALTAADLTSRLGTDVQGVFAEYIALPETSLIKAPANLTSEEASTLPIAGLTAWEAIVKVGNLKTGQTLLLQGTGGVSIFALQFAKIIGAKVIITSSSNEKLAKAKTLGADEVINYNENPNWQELVQQLTQGAGVDLAIEMSWTEIDKTIQSMKLGGKIITVGLLGGINATLSIFGLLQKSLSIQAIQVGSKASFADMNQAIELHDLKPHIDSVFSINEFPKALHHFDQANHTGKVVLTFNS